MDINLLDYKKILELAENKGENKFHLLLGNGFNNSLGIKTDYKSIFQEMQKEYAGYQDLTDIMKEKNYDLEIILEGLETQIQSTNSNQNFLKKYIHRKIKLDFMKATQQIVKKYIKNIYREKNTEVYLLLKNFNNYFTLNYDLTLYLLLMKFKKDDDHNDAVTFLHTNNFKIDISNQQRNHICQKIKEAYKKGSLRIKVGTDKVEESLESLPKKEFENQVKRYFRKEYWTSQEIKNAIDDVWKDLKIKATSTISLDDGFTKLLLPTYNKKQVTQNLFFLHGAFHIYSDRNIEHKITQTQDKALYNRLEEIINSEEKNIVCIFKNSTEGKKKEIEGSNYLKDAHNKLAELDGSIVIIGSSLADNDRHIFERIGKNNRITNIYISSCETSKIADYKKAKNHFQNQEIILFDWETISYS